MYETLVICHSLAAATAIPPKGEFTLVVPPPGIGPDQHDERATFDLFSSLVAGVPIPEATARRLTALAEGVTEKAVTRIIKKHKILAKRHIGPST